MTGPDPSAVRSSRLIALHPNARVPSADAMETAECWQLSLRAHDGPTVLALTPEPAAGTQGLRSHPLRPRSPYELRRVGRRAAEARCSPHAPRSEIAAGRPGRASSADCGAGHLGTVALAVLGQDEASYRASGTSTCQGRVERRYSRPTAIIGADGPSWPLCRHSGRARLQGTLTSIRDNALTGRGGGVSQLGKS